MNFVFNEEDMRQPLCPLFGKCGGCSLMNIVYSAQVREKQNAFAAAMGRLSSSAAVESPVTGPELGYRSRARFTYSKEGLSFSEERSNEQVLLKACPVLDEKMNSFLSSPPKLNIWELKDRQLSCISTDRKVTYNQDMDWVTVKNHRFPVSGDVFFQSNRFLLPEMIDYIVSNVEGNNVMDLYAGIGTFSAFLEESHSVTAVEINRKCLSMAKQHLAHTSFFSSPVERWNPRKHAVDTVIVDPPRVGLEKNVPSLIASFKPSRIIYVSCYLQTMERDVHRLLQLGYSLEKGRMFDFYPQTNHMETVVCLNNKNPRPKSYVEIGIDAEEYYRIKDKG